MRLLWLFSWMATIAGGTAVAVAQAPPSEVHSVSLCDLLQNPKTYDAQWVSISAHVSMEFEDFSLYDPSCKTEHLQHYRVWLTFGGDQNEVTTFCCGDHDRKPNTDIEIEGHRIPLVRDEKMREFLRVLQTQRLRRPDGQPCQSEECFYYRPITATLIGFFVAGDLSGNALGPGYGHLGCCHLLVIKQVSDFVADRTPVPAGGRFTCSDQNWNVPSSDASVLDAELECSSASKEKCVQDRHKALSQIAAHWNDTVDTSAGFWDRYARVWLSADLLTTYSIGEEPARSSRNLTITRKVCAPASKQFKPSPLSGRPSCNEYGISWADLNQTSSEKVDKLLNETKYEAAFEIITRAPNAILADGDQAWRLAEVKLAARHALRAQSKKWGIVPDPGLQLEYCRKDDIESGSLWDCHWYSLNGMQEFSANLAKFSKSTKTDPTGRKIPWSIMSLYGTTCHVTPSSVAAD